MHNFKLQDYKKKQVCLYSIQEFQGVMICCNYYMLREISATWHFAKSEDIHFLVPVSSIVNCN